MSIGGHFYVAHESGVYIICLCMTSYHFLKDKPQAKVDAICFSYFRKHWLVLLMTHETIVLLIDLKLKINGRHLTMLITKLSFGIET